MTVDTHEAYFRTVPEDIRPRFEAIQARVESLFPDATRCISYQLPAFRDGKAAGKGKTRVFFYFAAFKKHIGIYPPVSKDRELIRELEPYRGPKGNLSFPHRDPLPIDLIGRVAEALHREYAEL